MRSKKIYLTIDDSPSKDFLKKVTFLAERKIPAILFCNGDKMNENFEEIIFAIENGFYIGSHAYHHKHFSTLSLNSCIEEIRETDNLIKKIYKKCGISDYPKIIRFPYGDKGDFKFGLHLYPFSEAYQLGLNKWRKVYNRLFGLWNHQRYAYFLNRKQQQGDERRFQIQGYLKNLGYIKPDLDEITHPFYDSFRCDHDWMWTFDTGEWKYNAKMDLFEFKNNIFEKINSGNLSVEFSPHCIVNEMICQESNDILLIHDHEYTKDIFYSIIEYMKSNKFVFLDPFG